MLGFEVRQAPPFLFQQNAPGGEHGHGALRAGNLPHYAIVEAMRPLDRNQLRSFHRGDLQNPIHQEGHRVRLAAHDDQVGVQPGVPLRQVEEAGEPHHRHGPAPQVQDSLQQRKQPGRPGQFGHRDNLLHGLQAEGAEAAGDLEEQQRPLCNGTQFGLPGGGHIQALTPSLGVSRRWHSHCIRGAAAVRGAPWNPG